MDSELAEGVVAALTEQEKAYFDNRGNVTEPTEDEEPLDVVEDDEEPGEIELDEPDEDTLEADKPKKQVVPIKALHKEREARKELEQWKRQAEVDRARMEERMNILLQRMQEPAQTEEEQIPGDDDPIGMLHHSKKQAEALEKRLEAFEQQAKRDEQSRQIQQFATYHEQTFAKSTPDYYEAVDFLKNSRAAELRMFGFPDQQIQQLITEESHGIISVAAQNGKSPAEIAYAIAKQRGYQTKAPATEVQPSTKSLSQASGSPPGAKLSAQDILRMSPDEFSRFSEKNPKKLRQLMGG